MGGCRNGRRRMGVHDHVIDALRYFFVNHFPRRWEVREVKY